MQADLGRHTPLGYKPFGSVVETTEFHCVNLVEEESVQFEEDVLAYALLFTLISLRARILWDVLTPLTATDVSQSSAWTYARASAILRVVSTSWIK